MAAPLKPWERTGMNNPNPGSLPFNSMSSVPPSFQNVPAAGASASASAPPPVPARPNQSTLGTQQYTPGYGMGAMSTLGYSPYSSYGGLYNSSPYSSYGGYGTPSGYGGYNRLGTNQNSMSTFARHAEESSRPAFQAIENVVGAVSSVGMMMDSTFQAVYNSFRAVIGVADNMSRLKSQLISVISALAFIRTLKYIYRRFLELMRLRPRGYATQAWNDAVYEAAANMSAGSSDPKKSAWPIVMFFGIILGAPWLIWKVIKSFSNGSSDSEGWASGEDDHFVARAEYSFSAGNDGEISFTTGQMINVAPKEMQPRVRGWLLGCADGKHTGLLPANYVKVLGKRRGKKHETFATTESDSNNTGIVPSESALNLAGPVTSETALNSVPENDLDTMFQEAGSSVSMEASDILDNCGSETTKTGDGDISQTTQSEIKENTSDES